LTAAIDAMRGNMLQGMNLSQELPQVGILLAWFLVPFIVSLRIFRWR
jgi:ABC-2 type transport system permease protein